MKRANIKLTIKAKGLEESIVKIIRKIGTKSER